MLGVTTVFGDLSLGMPKIEVKQSRRRLDPRVYSNGAKRMKSQHALVKLDVARVHLNDEVGAAPNSARIDVRSVEKRGNNRLRLQRFIYGEPCEFAHSPRRPTQ